jgi:hypothetical protein
MPVMLPPGRARLAIRPVWIGSPLMPTIGIVLVGGIVLRCLRHPMLDDDVLSLDISVVAQPSPNRLGQIKGRSVGRPLEEPDSVDLLPAGCASPANGARARLAVSMAVSPTSRIGHLVGDGCGESSRTPRRAPAWQCAHHADQSRSASPVD